MTASNEDQGGLEEKLSKNERIESFLSEKFKFRFNTIKSRCEFWDEIEKEFAPVIKYSINSIRRKLDKAKGINTSGDNIRTILESDFTERINPVQEYFYSLPKRDGQEAIIQLANTIIVQDKDHWVKYLTKWLVGVVANALNKKGCQNHVCLVLSGEQGKFKTTWLDLLCPKPLNNYIFTGKIDPQNKDVLTLVAEYLFINIDDQLKALNKKDENELKNLITTPSVKYRRPYDVYIEEYSHLASFMASVNGNDFLTDPTGSRRFLPFEALEIDIEAAKNINMDDVYSEIMTLFTNGFRYWFNDDEIQELHRHNSAFHVQTIEYELLMQGFTTTDEETDRTFMTTAQIISYLRVYSILNLNEKRMGAALRQASFVRKSKRMNKRPIYGWFIKKVEPNPFLP